MTVTFDEQTGDVLVASSVGTDRIIYGVVLLAPEQAKESLRHGWRESKFESNEEREAGLVRMYRSVTTQAVVPMVMIDGHRLTPEQSVLLRAAVQTMLQFMERASDSPLRSTARLQEINELLSRGK